MLLLAEKNKKKKTCFKDWENEGSNKSCFWQRRVTEKRHVLKTEMRAATSAAFGGEMAVPCFKKQYVENFVPYFLYCGSKVFHLKLKYELIENAFFSAEQTVKLSGLTGNFLKNAWIAVKCCLICLHLTIIIIVMRTDFTQEHHVSILHSNGMN